MTRRLAPLEPDEWSDATREVFGGTANKRPLNILATIAHHPHLLQPFLGFAATLATRGVLPRRASELLALRAAWNCRSAFEWAHHAVYAEAAGLTGDEIRRVAGRADDPLWSDADRLLLRAADQLHRDQDLDQATWDALAQHWNEAQLVEIPFVVGNYTMLSMVANATGVPVEEGFPALPEGDSHVEVRTR